MATHKRTRTGCWTCREAGYKCDEQKPFCGRCIRLKITCKGYGIKLKWRDDVATTQAKPARQPRKQKTIGATSTASPESIGSFSSSPYALGTPSDLTSSPESTFSLPVVPLINPTRAPDLSSNDRWLLHYWVAELSSVISMAPRNSQNSPFQVYLTSMAYESAALRATILSMAANHLAQASNDSSLRWQGYRYQRDAIHELQQVLQDPHDSDFEPALATVLMMQMSARLFSDEDDANVVNHLMGAKAMISRHESPAKQSSTSSTQFLLSLFAYHDILSSVSRGSRPLADHEANFVAVEGDRDMESIANVLLVVARISNLQNTIKERRSISNEHALTEAEDATGRMLQQTLLDLNFGTPSHNGANDVRTTAEAYRHAAFIYLYRTWLDVGAPNLISMDHVTQCLRNIEQVDTTSPLSTSHVWPLFTAGCEAIDVSQRDFVRTRFEEMYTTRRFPNLRRVMRDIEDVWHAKDLEQKMEGQDGMAKVDCIQVILRRRGREVDLI